MQQPTDTTYLQLNQSNLRRASIRYQEISKGRERSKGEIFEIYLKRVEHRQGNYIAYYLGGQETWNQLLHSEVNRPER